MLTDQLEEAELAQTARMGLGQGCPPPQPQGGWREGRGQSPPKESSCSVSTTAGWTRK